MKPAAELGPEAEWQYTNSCSNPETMQKVTNFVTDRKCRHFEENNVVRSSNDNGHRRSTETAVHIQGGYILVVSQFRSYRLLPEIEAFSAALRETVVSTLMSVLKKRQIM